MGIFHKHKWEKTFEKVTIMQKSMFGNVIEDGILMNAIIEKCRCGEERAYVEDKDGEKTTMKPWYVKQLRSYNED